MSFCEIMSSLENDVIEQEKLLSSVAASWIVKRKLVLLIGSFIVFMFISRKQYRISGNHFASSSRMFNGSRCCLSLVVKRPFEELGGQVDSYLLSFLHRISCHSDYE